MKIFGFEVEESSMPDLKQFMRMVNEQGSREGLKETITQKPFAKLKQYSTDAAEMEPTGGWQGRQDAARHLLAVGETARVGGKGIASVLATLNEWIGIGSTAEDTKMDEHNNRLALELFNAKDYEEVKQRVKKMMESVQYKDMSDPTKPVINTLE